MKNEPPFLLEIEADEYHANPAVGHSSLVKIMRSPAHYLEYITNKPGPTPAMLLGTAAHAAILEPALFSRDFVAAPSFDRRTKEGKALAEAWANDNAGKTPLTPEQFEAVQGMSLAVQGHAGAARLLGDGIAEGSAFWTDAETGIGCKCRPDFTSMLDGNIVGIADVKTCADASTEEFARSMVKFGYDLQAAFYQDGIKAITGSTVPFYFVAVEKTAPYAVAVYRASDEVIEVGRAKYRGALQLMKWCQDSGGWPGYQPSGEIEVIDLPRWAANFSLDEE